MTSIHHQVMSHQKAVLTALQQHPKMQIAEVRVVQSPFNAVLTLQSPRTLII